jgi:hypothetical protein
MANQSTSDWPPARLAPAGTFVGRVDEAGLLADLPVLLARDPFVPPGEGARLVRLADHGEAAAAYDVVGAIDSVRLPLLPDSISPSGGEGGRGGKDQDDDTGDGQDTPKKRGGHGGAGRCKRAERFGCLAWRHEVPTVPQPGRRVPR